MKKILFLMFFLLMFNGILLAESVHNCCFKSTMGGRYQIFEGEFTVNTSGQLFNELRIFKIDSKTGKVWVYEEVVKDDEKIDRVWVLIKEKNK